MNYSFIQVEKKPTFGLFMRIWLTFVCICVCLILCFYVWTLFQVFSTNSKTEKYKQEATAMQQKITENEELFQELSKRKTLIEDAIKNNVFLTQKVHNIFDFIIKSDSIRLESLQASDTELELRGITPTKEMFLLLIQTPLRSIFDESTTHFYPLKNGWYKFVNISKRFPTENSND